MILFYIFLGIAALERLFSVVDKRTGFGRIIKWIFRVVGFILLAIIIFVYVFC